jgi:DNA polymerase-3 subunit alpha
MKNHGLNKEEIEVFKEHLSPLNGVADTQESIMLLSMDKRIAGFDTGDATLLRKTVAKRSEDALKKTLKLLHEKSSELGVRKEVIDYFWNVQVSRMLNYAFSSPHVLAYSLIALIQLNMNLYYNPLYWKTAVLSVNSGSSEVEEDSKAKTTDYGKTASAIGRLKAFGTKIDLPLINKAHFSFVPNIDSNSIVYGLKGINGIGDEIISEIIKYRPYSSFDDFHERLYQTKIIAKGQLIKLIKAGSFTEFGSPTEIMKQFLIKEVDVKDKLNGQNLARIISLGLLDSDELIKYKHYYNFKSHISKFVHETVAKPKDKILILDALSQSFFYNNFSEKSITGWHNSQPLISEKLFKKEYDEKMEHVTELMQDKEFIRSYNIAQFYELWADIASGNQQSWEMESVSFYSNEHELQNVDYAKYGISNFFDISETPIVLSENTGKNGRVYKNLQLFNIVGTVLDKNKNNHSITILTPEGVVTCKTYGGAFSHYDRQISSTSNGKKQVLERSWLTRGHKILVSGFRRDDTFVLKALQGNHTINLITEIRDNGTLGLQSERARI